jgi:hypothetical protein
MDTPTVVGKLVDLGVLKRQSGGLFSIAATPQHDAIDLPEGLYERVVNRTVGLVEDAFVGQLMKNDWLYNIVFWQTADAYDRGLLSPEDAPDFMKQYLEALGS